MNTHSTGGTGMKRAYLLDGAEITWRGLIDVAKSADPDFGSDGLLTTSEAASILRRHGHTVEEASE